MTKPDWARESYEVALHRLRLAVTTAEIDLAIKAVASALVTKHSEAELEGGGS